MLGIEDKKDTKQFELSLDLETARALRDETLPEEGFEAAAFCSVRGPKLGSMNYSAKVESFTAAEAESVLSQIKGTLEPQVLSTPTRFTCARYFRGFFLPPR